MLEPIRMEQQIMGEVAKWRHHYRWLLLQVMITCHSDVSVNHRLVSPDNRAPDCCGDGRGFELQTGPAL